MENKSSKGGKTITNLLSKTVGLIFFSFLAISLGVVFGLLFEGWVKEQPGTPVGSENSTLQTVDLSDEKADTVTQDMVNTDLSQPVADNPLDNTAVQPVVTVKYKVRVGPYASRTQALAASTQLQSMGYPVFVGTTPPFTVQVGAFSAQNNAERLKNELVGKGYKVSIDQN